MSTYKAFSRGRRAFTTCYGFVFIQLVLFWVFPLFTFAQVPDFINYQSRLRDTSGTPITAANVIQFSIYNHETDGTPTSTPGSAGPLLWTETYDQVGGSCALIDPDDDGYLTVQLGTCVSFPEYLDFDTDDLYLGVKIASDPEATPRARLGTTPFSYTSEKVRGTGQSTIGTTTAASSAVLTVEATSTNAIAAVFRGIAGQIADIFQVIGAAGERLLTIAANGFLGVGTSTPSAQLTVEGDTLLYGDLSVIGTTTLTGDLLPGADNVYSLGSPSYRWADLWVGPGTIHIGESTNHGRVGYSTSSNYLVFDPDGDDIHDIVFNDLGDVGIGTTTPLHRLTIFEDGDTSALYVEQVGSGSAAVLFGDVGIGTDAPTAALEVVGNIVSAGTSWTSQSAAASNQWSSVTYGNGLFVAVSWSGTVMTSSDGVNWTTQTAAESNQWRSVTYGNGLFVAVAGNGTNRVMTSPDGINWTARAATGDNTWYAVTYGNGLFVAVANGGTGGYVMTSPDGITWTARTAAENNNWYGVTYGNGLFVAVAHSGAGTNRVMTSPDGITWTSQTAAENQQWQSVTYGNGLFVATARSGTNRVMTSPDGIIWTAHTVPETNSWISVTYGAGLFVAVAGDGTNRVMTSPDGISWTARPSAANNFWNSVTYGNGQFVAVSLTGSDRVMTSGVPDRYVTPHNNLYQGNTFFATNVGLGTTTAYNLLTIDGGMYLSSTTPINTGYALYNQGGVLYWNGTELSAVIASTTATTTFSELTVTGTSTLATATILGDLFTDLTPGSVPFIGSSGLLSEDNNNFFWDASNNRLGIGTDAPGATLTVAGDSYFGSEATFADSLTITSVGSPSATSSALYNQAGTLYWDGLSVNTAFEQVIATTGGTIDITTANQVGVLDFNASTTDASGVTFNNDGSLMYLVDEGNSILYQYQLLVPFSVLTVSSQATTSVASTTPNPIGIAFNDDGSKLYLSSATSTGVIYEYDLTVNFDISTTTTLVASSSITFSDPNIVSIAFNQNGTTLFVLGNTNEDVDEYSLGTAYDITTLSASPTATLDLTGTANDPYGIAFNASGERLYVSDDANNTLYEYELPTGFDLSTTALSTNSYDFSASETSPRDIALDTDGDSLFLVGRVGADVTEFRFSVTGGSAADGSIELVYLDPVLGDGFLALGQDTALNRLSVNGGIYLSSTTPNNVTSALYSLGEFLYWSGDQVLTLNYDSADGSFIFPPIPLVFPSNISFSKDVTHKGDVTNEGDTTNEEGTRQYYKGRDPGSILFLEQDCTVFATTTLCFGDPYLSEDNDFLYYDWLNRRVGIGTNNPTNALTVDGTGEFKTGIITSYLDQGVIPFVGINNSLRDSLFLYFSTSTQTFFVDGGNIQAFEGNPVNRATIDDTSCGASCTLADATDVAVRGKHAFVTSGIEDTVAWLDISNPNEPTQIAAVQGLAPVDAPEAVGVLGSYVYVVSPTENALYIYEATDPSVGLQQVGTLDKDQCEADLGIGNCPMTGANNLYVTPNYVYLTSPTDDGFSVIDVTDKTKPTLVAGVTASSSGAQLRGAYDVVVKDNVAYVTAETDNAMVLFDVIDPTNPTLIAFVADGGSGLMVNPRELIIQDHYAFILAHGSSNVVMIDIQDSGALAFTSKFGDAECLGGALCDMTGLSGITAAGDYLYIVHESTGLLTVLNYTGGSVVPLSFTSQNTAGGAPEAIEAVGKYLYIASNATPEFQVWGLSGLEAPGATIGTLETDDVHVDRLLSVTGVLETENINTSLLGLRLDLLEEEGILFGGVGGLLSQDTANFLWSASTTEEIQELNVAGDVFVIATEPKEFGYLDDNGCDAQHSNLCALQGASDVFVRGNYAYVAAEEDDGFSIIDVTIPGVPKFVNAKFDNGSEFLDGATAIRVQDQYAYVTSGVEHGLSIYDVSDPTNITLRGSITDDACDASVGGDGCALQSPQDVYVVGNYAYVAAYNDNGISVFDVQNPENPVHVDSLFASTTPAALLRGVTYLDYVNETLYAVSFLDEAFVRIDVSDAKDLEHIDSYTSVNLEGANAVKIHGRYAFVTAGLDHSLVALDLGTTTVTEAGLIDNDTCNGCSLNAPSDLEIVGDFAYITLNTAQQGVSVINISDPADMSHTAFISDDASTHLTDPSAIHVVGKYAYVTTTGDDALTVLDIAGVESPSGDFGTLTVDTLDVWQDITALGSMLANAFIAGTGGIVSSGDVRVADSDITVTQSEPAEVSILTDIVCGAKSPTGTCTLASSNDIEVDSDRIHVYIASDFEDGITKLDVSDKENPSPVSVLALNAVRVLKLAPDSGRNSSPSTVGNRAPMQVLVAATGGSTSTLTLIDTEDETDDDDDSDYDEMSVLSSINDNDCDVQTGGNGCALDDVTAMEIIYHPLADVVVAGSTNDQGIAIVDISSTTNPLHITSEYDDASTGFQSPVSIKSPEFKSAYVLSQLDEAITMFNLASEDLFDPQIVAEIEDGVNGIRMENPVDMEFDDDDDDIVYVASPSNSSSTGALTIIDVEDIDAGNAPRQLSYLEDDDLDGASSIDQNGDDLFIGVVDGVIQVDISNPTAPRIVGKWDDTANLPLANVADVEFDRGYIYTVSATENALAIGSLRHVKAPGGFFDNLYVRGKLGIDGPIITDELIIDGAVDIFGGLAARDLFVDRGIVSLGDIILDGDLIMDTNTLTPLGEVGEDGSGSLNGPVAIDLSDDEDVAITVAKDGDSVTTLDIDLEDGEDPSILDSLNNSDCDLAFGSCALDRPIDIAVSSDDIAIVASDVLGTQDSDGLSMFDVTEPANIVYLDSLFDGACDNGFDANDSFEGCALSDITAVVVEGDYAYTGNGAGGGEEAGLSIVEINPIGELIYRAMLEDDGSGTMDFINDIDVEDDIAYIVDSSGGLTSIDVSDTDNPSIFSTIPPSGLTSNMSPTGIDVEDDFAYIISGPNNRISVVDVSDPNNMNEVNSVPTEGDEPTSIEVIGTRLYLTESHAADHSVSLYDITDPEEMFLVTTLSDTEFLALAGAADVAVGKNGVIVAAEDDDAIQVIRRDRAQVEAGNINQLAANDIDAENADLSRLTVNDSVRLNGGVVATDNHQLLGGDFFQSIGSRQLFTQFVSFFDSAQEAVSGAADNLVDANLAMVASFEEDTVSILGISDITNPSDIEDEDTIFSIGSIDDGTPLSFEEKSHFLAQLLGVNEAMATKVSDFNAILDGVNGLAKSGDIVVATAGLGNGLSVIDVGDPSEPALVGVLSNAVCGQQAANVGGTCSLISPTDVEIYEDVAVVLTDGNDSIITIDISDPTEPQFLDAVTDDTCDANTGSCAINDPQDIEIEDGYAFVVSQTDDGMSVFDIRDSKNIVYVGSVTDNTSRELDGASSIEVVNSIAYITAGVEDALSIIDVSDPANPVYLEDIDSVACDFQASGNCALEGAADVAVLGNTVFVAAADESGISAFDVSSSTQIEYISSVFDTAELALSNVSDLSVSALGLLASSPIDDGVTLFDVPTIDGIAGVFDRLTFNSGSVLDDFGVGNMLTVTGNAHVGGIVTSEGLSVRGDGIYSHGDIVVSDTLGHVATYFNTLCDQDATLFGCGLDDPIDIKVVGDYAYITADDDVDGDSFTIIDISDPTRPRFSDSLFDGSPPYLTDPQEFAISGDYAYVTARQDNRLTIIDISDKANAVQVGSINDASCNPNCALALPDEIYVHEGYAYVGSPQDDGFSVIDVSTPSSPTHVRSVFDTGVLDLTHIEGIYAYSNRLYTIDGDDDVVEMWDITDPATTVFWTHELADNGSTILLDGVTAITGDGEYLYVLNSGATNPGVMIFDMSNPSLPTATGFLLDSTLGNLSDARDFALSGDRLYVTGDDYVAEIDVHDPTNPVFVDSFTDTAETALDTGWGIAASDGYIFAISLTEAGMTILNRNAIEAGLAKFTDLTVTGDLATDFADGAMVFSNNGVLAQTGGQLHWDSTNSSLGIRADDLRDDAALTIGGGGIELRTTSVGTTTDLLYNVSGTLHWDGQELTTLSASSTSGTTGATLRYNSFGELEATTTLSVSDNGYVGIGSSSPSAQLELFGGSFKQTLTSDSFSVAGTFTGANDIEAISVAEGYAFAADSVSNLVRVVDITDPINPIQVDTALFTGANISDLVYAGEYVFVTDGAGNALNIFDVSDPENIVSVFAGSLTGGAVNYDKVEAYGDYLYLTSGTADSVLVVDVTIPANPVVLSSASTTVTTIDDTYYQGGLLYVVEGGGGNTFEIISVSDPYNVASLGSVTVGSNLNSVAVEGNYAYVTSQTGVLYVIDVSSSTNPFNAASILTGGTPDDIAVINGLAYIVDENLSVIVAVDVRTPTSPEVVTQSNLLGTSIAGDIEIQGRYAYVKDDTTENLLIIEMPVLETPTIYAGEGRFGQLFATQDITAEGLITGSGLEVIGQSFLSGLNLSPARSSYELPVLVIAGDTVGVGDQALATINQTGTGDIFTLLDNGTTTFIVRDGGSVGIGTSTPTTTLTVAGDTTLYDKLYALGESIFSQIATFNDALTVASTTPSATSSSVYNLANTLYWNGLSIDTAFETVVATTDGSTIVGGAFDIGNTAFTQSTTTLPHDNDPSGLRFNPDGTRVFFAGRQFDRVYQYDLSTAYDISTAVFATSTYIGGQDDTPTDLAFNADGTKMYIAGALSNAVLEYDLPAAYDVSTSTFVQSTSTAAQDTSPAAIEFNNDGTKMFIMGGATDGIYEYDLSTAYDISTVAFSQATSTTAHETSPTALRFNTDGSSLFFAGFAGGAIYQYDLGTAFNVTTSAFIQSTSTAAQDGVIVGLEFDSAGSKVFALGVINDAMYEYDITGVAFNQLAVENSAELVYLDPTLGSGYFALGTTTAQNLLTVQGGVYLASTTPININNALYNLGSDLYWSGNQILYNGSDAIFASLTVTGTTTLATTSITDLTVTGSSTLAELLVQGNGIFNQNLIVRGTTTLATTTVSGPLEAFAGITIATSSDALGDGRGLIVYNEDIAVKAGNPTFVSNIAPGVSFMDGMDVEGDYAYTNNLLGHGFRVVDIKDPANQVVVGTWSPGDTNIMERPRGIDVVGNYAYVGGDRSDNMAIVDVSDPTNPTTVSTYQPSGTTMGNPTDIEVVGNLAYIADAGSDRMFIVNIADPTNPTTVGIWDVASTTIFDGARDIDVVGTYAYLTGTNSDNFVIVDVSDPTNPVLVGNFDPDDTNVLEWANAIAISGSYAYIGGDQSHNLLIVDIADPTNPTLIANFDPGTGTLNGFGDIQLAGDYAVIASGNANEIILADIASSTNPTLAGTYSGGLDEPQDMRVVGEYVYISSFSNSRLITIKLPTLNAPAATIGSLASNQLTVDELFAFDGYLRGGITVAHDAFIGGGLSITGSASTTAIAGNTDPALTVVSGYVGIGTTTPSSMLTVTGTSYFGATSTFLGNVGIGTTSPSQLFTVAGDMYLTGALFDSTHSSGTAGYVLQSTATGTQWVATSTLGFSSGGSSLWTQSGADIYYDTGNVGIGDTDPTEGNLVVRSSSDAILAIIKTGLGVGGIERTSSTTNFYSAAGNAADRNIVFSSGSSQATLTEWMRIDENGNVGIGTTTPTSALTVSGNIDIDGSLFANLANITGKITAGSVDISGNIDTTLGAGGVIFTDVDGILTVDTSSFYWDETNGRLGIGTSSPERILHLSDAASPRLLVTDTTNGVEAQIGSGDDAVFVGSLSNHDLRINIFNDEKMRVTTGGEVGIGTTTPSHMLTVAGDAFIGGALYDNSNEAGTAGQVLSSTGSGLDWITPAFSNVWTQSGSDIYYDTGNVGIGITSPTTDLTVERSSNTEITDLRVYNNDGNGISQIYAGANGGGHINLIANSSSTSYLGISANSPGIVTEFSDMIFATGNGGSATERLRIKDSGEIGIGDAAADYALEIATSTTNGYFGVSGGNDGDIFLIDGSGNVAIGTTTVPASTKVHIDGGHLDWNWGDHQIDFTTPGGDTGIVFNEAQIGNYSRFDVKNTPNATLGNRYFSLAFNGQDGVWIDYSGDVQFTEYGAGTLQTDASGNITASSDENLKNIIGDFEKGLDAISGLKPIDYRWTAESGLDTTSTYSGFTAQNVQLFIPEAVGENDTGHLTLSDRTIMAAAVNAIQELDEKVENRTASSTVIIVTSSSTVGIGTSTPDEKLVVDGNIKVTGTYLTEGADYAEYFFTRHTNLTPGEVVCIDTLRENAVERCADPRDTNVMGIVSTNPAFLGNATLAKRFDDHQVMVAMLGQIPAKVSTINGEIRAGDALTPALNGHIMKADAGDATVAIALEEFEGSASSTEEGTIQVLISRRNQSVTVEQVEQEVTERIAAMEIEDEVVLMLDEAITALDLDGDILAIVEEELNALDITTEVNSTLTIVLRNLGLIAGDEEVSSTTASSTPEEVPGWMNRVVELVVEHIVGTFADIGNGIGDFFANRVRTQEICLGEGGTETCLTKSDLDALLINTTAEAETTETEAGAGETTDSTPEEPVVDPIEDTGTTTEEGIETATTTSDGTDEEPSVEQNEEPAPEPQEPTSEEEPIEETGEQLSPEEEIVQEPENETPPAPEPAAEETDI